MFKNARGYKAQLIAMRDGRVLFHAWDEGGKRIQTNGCVSEAYWLKSWQPA